MVHCRCSARSTRYDACIAHRASTSSSRDSLSGPAENGVPTRCAFACPPAQDLVRNPTPEIQRLAWFFGFCYTDAIVESVIRQNSQDHYKELNVTVIQNVRHTHAGAACMNLNLCGTTAIPKHTLISLACTCCVVRCEWCARNTELKMSFPVRVVPVWEADGLQKSCLATAVSGET